MSDKRFNSVVWISVRTHFPDFENSNMKLSRNFTIFDYFKVALLFLVWNIFNIKLDIKIKTIKNVYGKLHKMF